MDQHTKENWKKVKAALETANKTDCFFYKRAVAICAGGRDLIKDERFDLSTDTLPGVGDQA